MTMIDLNYQKQKEQKTEPEEIAMCIFGSLIILINVIAFMVAL